MKYEENVGVVITGATYRSERLLGKFRDVVKVEPVHDLPNFACSERCKKKRPILIYSNPKETSLECLDDFYLCD